ncbi:MAG TPA: flagellar protein FlaG [Pseudoalteromonas sp.]|uniref:Flagellar protein FlaG protein n=1 Tax=marine sediment metagenome TaxID=412755 RepID=A0A0F9KTH0_9ZZZZ|nr:flagellar protein FlaG [Pseudoalteromonas sp.]HDY93452.1 flagellar protein FlaG [Pseudoalteromonas sp.]HDZ35261.1 flagellar protein FlaG [Pseudoalteromonas sp.]
MNTINSNAEVTLPTPLAGEDKVVGQAASSLTERAVDDVKQVDTQNQQRLQQNQYEKNNQEVTAQPLEREQLEKMAQQLQEFMGEMNRSLQFQVDEDSGRDVIKVLDKATGDIIKQYPSEEVLNLVSKLSETAGLLIDQTI